MRFKKQFTVVAIFALMLQSLFMWAPSARAADTNFHPPSAVVSNTGWANPERVYSSDNNRATADITTDIVEYGTFNLGVPGGATINGIEVRLEGFNNFGRQAEISLTGNVGATWTQTKITSTPLSWTSSDGTALYGTATDKWGRVSWNYDEFSNANFRLRLDATTSLGDLKVDSLAAKVYYTPNTPPTTPTLLSPTDASLFSDNTPLLGWNSATDAEGNSLNYGFEIGSSYDFSSIVLTGGTAGTAFQVADANALADGTYYWRVRANDGFASGAWSTGRSFTVDATAPAVPTLIAPSDNAIINPNTSGTSLSWSTVTDLHDPIQYRLELSSDGGTNWILQASGDITTLSLVGAGDSTFMWRVLACDAIAVNPNCSAPSAGRILTLDSTAPLGVGVPVAKNNSGDVLTSPMNNKNVNWEWTRPDSTVAGFSHYEWELYKDGVLNKTNDTINTQVSKVLSEGTYRFQVRAWDKAGNVTPYSVSDNLVYDKTPPDVPAMISPTDGSYLKNNDPVFDWSLTPNAYRYQLQVCGMDPGDYGLNSTCSDEVIRQNGLSVDIYTLKSSQNLADGEYWWRVRARDEAGNFSLWSGSNQLTIDTISPIGTVDYSTLAKTNTEVTAILIPDEPVIITNIGGPSHMFNDNGSFTFTFKDYAGNPGSAIATVGNINKIAPIITVNGVIPPILVGGTYTELGATVTDDLDGSFAATPTGSVNTNIAGSYSITYNAIDSAGNNATPVTRMVEVLAASIGRIPAQPLQVTTATTTATLAPTTTETTPPAVQGAETSTDDKKVKGDVSVDVDKKDDAQTAGSSWWNWWYLLVILVILGAGYWFIFGAKRGKKNL